MVGLPGSGNIIGGNVKNGEVEIGGAATTGNTISGNKIGANAANAVGLGNSLDGVLIDGAALDPVSGNVISGNKMNGVHLQNGATGILIQDNFIGSNAAGTAALANTGSAILIANSSNNTIGGATPPLDNLIAFNTGNGITITGTSTGDRIQQNSIFSNLLGIDLDNNGVTPNTPGGPHGGANHDQNFPVIMSAGFNGPSGASVNLSMNGTPNSTFTVELFDSPAANASGFGEGKVYLGSVQMTTDANGNASSTFNVAGALAGTYITATATDNALLDTSEFSAAVKVSDGFPPKIDNVTFAYTKTHVTGVTVAFNEALNPATVTASNFELLNNDAHHNYTKLVALAKTNPLVYNATNDTVTLNFKSPLAASHFYKIFVNGTLNPVTDAAGTALDGEFAAGLPSGDGTPGGDFDAPIAFGTHFSYKDSLTNTVSLTLSQGGTMEMIRSMNGEGRYLELAKVVANKTILAGKVTKGKTGTGVTTLQEITGLGGAIDKLPVTQFQVAGTSVNPLVLAPWEEELN